MIMAQISASDIEHRGRYVHRRHRGATLRADAALDNTYEYTDHIDVAGVSKACLLFEVTKGSCTSFQYKIQTSHDGTTWFDWITDSAAAGTITQDVCEYTMTLSDDVDFYSQIDYFGRFLRVGVKCTGTKTGASCAVHVETRD